MKKRIAFQTFGCKLNFAETSTIAKTFPEEEYQLVDFDDVADVYVINSCSVTANAEKTCRAAARAAKRRNEGAKVAMLGCYSQIKADSIAQLPEVDWVLGNEDKFRLYDFLSKEKAEGGGLVANTNINKSKVFNPAYSSADRTRSFLKVQDGCDYFCTYCSIPFARGRSRSATIAQTIETAKEIGRSEAREIILSGVNIGDFGKLHNESFADFLRALEEVEGIDRIRISSVEPELLTHEIIDLVAGSEKIQPHFHIPLQSGSDEVLKIMKRNYSLSVYTDRVEYIKSLMPHACIAADVITGFPTETDEQFEDSYEYLAELPISYMHVFSYSPREGTYALRLENMVSPQEKKRRSKALHLLSDKKKRDFYSQNIGSEQEVLFEAQNQGGMMSGWTGNYIKVLTPYRPELVNTIQKVRLEELNEEGDFVW